MRRLLPLAALLAAVGVPVLLALAGCGPEPVEGPPAHEVSFRKIVQPVMADYCVGCHGGDEPDGGLSFDAWADGETVPDFADLRERTPFFERLTHHVMTGSMPPDDMPAPDDASRDAVVAWFTDTLEAAWAEAPPNPGRVTMRRLNRVEYRNTVRDLLGVDFEAQDVFPADEVGYGFDHIGDVLSLPPILMEKYLDAAEDIAARTIVLLPKDVPERQRVEAESARPVGRSAKRGGFVHFSSGTGVATRLVFPRTAEYRVRARVRPQQAGRDPAALYVAVAGVPRKVLPAKVPTGTVTEVETTLRVPLGTHRIQVGFANDHYDPKNPDRSQRDRNLSLDWFEIEGPLEGTAHPLPWLHRRLIKCAPEPGEERRCAESILRPLLTRAFRRPATAMEVERHVGLVMETMAAGESFEGGIQTALQAILISPQFLFRLELDEGTGATTRPLTEYELASRLSYFLWASAPDEALLAAAEAGTLRTSVHEHVQRMLKDDRAGTLVTNFAAQWLQLRRLDTSPPDPKKYKNVTDAMRGWMRRETELFVEAIFREDRSILDLIDAPFTYLNQPLAEFYGRDDVRGGEFRRVDVDPSMRGGLLGHASILTLTSYPHRTSPVLRGKWVMEELLGTPPPPPPPGVGTLEAQSRELLTRSVRERLAIHREDPACAVCHDGMDNLGYGLENYDAVGSWRTLDGPTKVDASGVLPGGRRFAGPAELKAILRGDEGVPRCFAEKLLTYALGRGLEPYDRTAVQQIVTEARERRLRFSAFVHAIVATDAFTMRRTAGDAE